MKWIQWVRLFLFVLSAAALSAPSFAADRVQVLKIDSARMAEELATFQRTEETETPIVVVPSKLPIVHPGDETTLTSGDHTLKCRTTSTMGGVGGWKANTWYDFMMCNADEVVVNGGAECVTGPLRAIHASTKGLNFIAVKCHNEGGIWVRVTCCK